MKNLSVFGSMQFGYFVFEYPVKETDSTIFMKLCSSFNQGI